MTIIYIYEWYMWEHCDHILEENSFIWQTQHLHLKAKLSAWKISKISFKLPWGKQSYIQIRIICRDGGGAVHTVFNFQNTASRMNSTLYKDLKSFWDEHMGIRVGVKGRKRKLKITKFSHISKFSATIIHFI